MKIFALAAAVVTGAVALSEFTAIGIYHTPFKESVPVVAGVDFLLIQPFDLEQGEQSFRDAQGPLWPARVTTDDLYMAGLAPFAEPYDFQWLAMSMGIPPSGGGEGYGNPLFVPLPDSAVSPGPVAGVPPVSAVPEPATYALMLGGVLAGLWMRRRA